MPGRPARRTGPAHAHAQTHRSGASRARARVGQSATAGKLPPIKRALQRALVRLSWRDQSTTDLRRALNREGFDREIVDSTLDRLGALRMVDDRAFAERFARRSLQRGLGRKRIAVGLSARGVARSTARAGLAEALETVSEREVLDTLARRYWERHSRVEPRLRLRRLWAFLLRRGFPLAAVTRSLSALCPRQREDIDLLSSDES